MSETKRIDPAEVDRIAALARLDPEPEERERLAEELSRIVDYFSQLSELDTDGVEPLHHVLDLHSVLREDVVRPSLPGEVALKNAPARKGDYFLVPKVIQDKAEE